MWYYFVLFQYIIVFFSLVFWWIFNFNLYLWTSSRYLFKNLRHVALNELHLKWISVAIINFVVFFTCFGTLFCNLLFSGRICLCFSAFPPNPLLSLSSTPQSGILPFLLVILADTVMEPESGSALFLVLRHCFCSLSARPTVLIRATVLVSRRWLRVLSASYCE